MTGFGTASAECEGSSIRLELKSVNHRGMKINVRSRPALGVFEKKVLDAIKKKLRRGAVDINISLTRQISIDQSPLLAETAKASVTAIRQIGEQLNLQDELSSRDLLLIPGLFDAGLGEPVTEQEWAVAEGALESSLEQLLQMREKEGEATVKKLLEVIEPVKIFRENALRRAPEVVARQREKLQSRLDELEAKRSCDEQALERELVFFADRADINEEMDRLESHLDQFAAIIKKGGELGKRLDFVAQEILREVNTTASKANDTEITSLAVEAKMAVEKIKEQAANLE